MPAGAPWRVIRGLRRDRAAAAGLLDVPTAARRAVSRRSLDRNGEVLYEARSDLGTRESRLEADSPAAFAGRPRRWLPRTIASTRTSASIRSRWREPRGGTSARPGSRRGRLDAHAAGRQASARSPHAAGDRSPARARLARRRSTRRSSRCGSSIGCTKAEILALYLNLAPYGNQIAGAERASQRRTSACRHRWLTPAQAAFLAALAAASVALQSLADLRQATARPESGARRAWSGAASSRQRWRPRRARNVCDSRTRRRRSLRRTSSRWSSAICRIRSPRAS